MFFKKTKKIFHLLSFAKVFPINNEVFMNFAKVFYAKYVLKLIFAKVFSAKFREFLVSRKFVPAKVCAPKVIIYLFSSKVAFP